jgi:hypothetical protein
MAANELLRAKFMQDLILMQLAPFGVDVYPRPRSFPPSSSSACAPCSAAVRKATCC